MSKKVQFGCYYAAYKNEKATRFVLENFRKHFPENPILLISDGGDDFSHLAKEFNCGYEHVHNIFEPKEDMYCSTRMLEYWRRLKLSTDYCNKEYLMILEDDVYIRNYFEINRHFNLCGSRKGCQFSSLIKKELRDITHRNIDIYGMCGGSFFNVEIFNKIYHEVILDIKNNHDEKIKNKEDNKKDPKRGLVRWSSLGSTDSNITYHFCKRGYFYEPNPWMIETGEANWRNSEHPIVHDYKEKY
tara:strand:- start:2361 stop:3092 length:732 start_codon:yes stop_codon:yes gene_type:complete